MAAPKTRNGDTPKGFKNLLDDLLEEMRNGVAPWTRPWVRTAGMPMNGASGRPYNGGNRGWLWIHSMVRGFDQNIFLTFNQAKKLDGRVKKGSRGMNIVRPRVIQVENEETGELEDRFLGFFLHTVFNVCDIEFDDPRVVKGYTALDERPEDTLPSGFDSVKAFVNNGMAHIEYGGDRAFYSRSEDMIRLPGRNKFESDAAFYGVLIHELAHWTGGKSRMDRPFGRPGTDKYAREELVAELAAAFVMNSLGHDGMLQHPQYLKSYTAHLGQGYETMFEVFPTASKVADDLLQRFQEAITAPGRQAA